MEEKELAFAGVARQAELLRRGEVSARELVETSLRRIERLDGELNAFRLVYFDRAMEEAKRAQRRLRARRPPPLLGVPVAIKDNVDVAGDVTTHGTSAYGEPAAEDAQVVRRIREAGAIVVGRTTCPPLCALTATESSTFGITRNPWNTDRSPGGSSGGSAAAVAAGMVPAALGSDGAGSIRTPASWCGLFGLKAQRGRVSLAPLPEHWHGLSVFGWLARSVGDTALLYDLTMGATEVDAEPAAAPERAFADATRAAARRLRIAYSLAVPPGMIGTSLDQEVSQAVTDTAELLRSLGHEVSERDPDYGLAGPRTVIRAVRGIGDEARTLPRFERLDRRYRNWARLSRLIPEETVRWARAHEAEDRGRIGRLFEDFDVLMTPVTSEPAIETGRWEGWGAARTIDGQLRVIPFPGIWNHTGQPAAAVPAGLSGAGLPLSVQLVGRPSDEGTLLSLAAQLETERGWPEWRPPLS